MAEQPKPFNQRVYSGYIRPFLDDYVSPAMSAVGRYVPPEIRSRLGSLVDVMPTPDTVTPTRNALAALGEGRYGTAAAETVNALAAPWLFTPMAAEMMMARGAQYASRANMLAPRADLPSTAEYGSLQRSISAGYDPPKVPVRPYEADYPRGGPGYDPSRPFTSPEGVVIAAPFVAGRRGYGAPDAGLLPGQSAELSRLLAGTVPEGVAARELPPRAVGSLRITPGPDRTTRQILFDQSLSPAKADRVIAHEVGHLIDGASGLSLGAFPKRETAKVYSDLYTGQAHRTRQLTGPQHVGYKPSEVPGELIAESIRAYMMDPAYLKTVAPKTARLIREYVNTHPTLSKIIQFNTLAAAALPALDGDR